MMDIVLRLYMAYCHVTWCIKTLHGVLRSCMEYCDGTWLIVSLLEVEKMQGIKQYDRQYQPGTMASPQVTVFRMQ